MEGGPGGSLPVRRLEDFTPFHLKNENVTAGYISPTIGIWASGLFLLFLTLAGNSLHKGSCCDSVWCFFPLFLLSLYHLFHFASFKDC